MPALAACPALRRRGVVAGPPRATGGGGGGRGRGGGGAHKDGVRARPGDAADGRRGADGVGFRVARPRRGAALASGPAHVLLRRPGAAVGVLRLAGGVGRRRVARPAPPGAERDGVRAGLSRRWRPAPGGVARRGRRAGIRGADLGHPHRRTAAAPDGRRAPRRPGGRRAVGRRLGGGGTAGGDGAARYGPPGGGCLQGHRQRHGRRDGRGDGGGSAHGDRVVRYRRGRVAADRRHRHHLGTHRRDGERRLQAPPNA